MRNQTSFRITTTVLPTDKGVDHKVGVTTVINKVDSNGDKFYPNFNGEETAVLTNDDRTVMETVRITTDGNGKITLVKRGLSDDKNATEIPNRALTWNPGTLCFITAGAGDWIDKDESITWSGDQTYTGKAEYKGRLITEKGVEYPHFTNLAALEAYANPFGGMFAVVDASGELYRYNAVTEEWSVVTTSTPTNPEMADDETIGTVRVATDAEFAAGTDTGSQGEYLVATPSQILGVSPDVDVNVFKLTSTSDTTGAQAILDNFLAGGTPVIDYGNGDYYYFDYYRSGKIYFVKNQVYTGSSDSGQYVIVINYSGTTVSTIQEKTWTFVRRVYFDSVNLTKAQLVLDAVISCKIVDVTSDYNNSDFYHYYVDKIADSGTNRILTLSTLGGNKHINITYSRDTETVSAMTFS